LIDILFFSHAKICEGPFLPGTFAYNPDIKSKYNPTQAKQILKKYGYDKNNPLTFTITTNANNKIRVYTAEILQYQLSKVNIKVKIKIMEWQAFLNTVVFPRNFEAVLLGWGLSLMPDARSIWHSSSFKKGGFNFIGYKNSEVDRLIEDSENSIDLKKIAKNYKKIYTLIANDYPYIFLYIPNSITAINKNVKNVTNSIIGIMHNFPKWEK
jgi:peptide/nickel transport system substrate-binding protein